MLWQLVLICFTLWAAVLWWQDRNKRRLSKFIKTDTLEIPLIGMTHVFLGNTENRMVALQDFGRSAVKYDGWTSMWLGRRLYLVVADPAEAEFVLKTCLDKDDLLKFTQQLIGNGSIFAPVPIWKPRRKVLAPTFSLRNLNQFAKIFQQQSSVMVEQLREVADKGTFSLWNYITSYTMDSVCETTLGSRLGVQAKRDHPFLQNFETVAQCISTRILQPWLHVDFVYQLTSYYTRAAEACSIINDFVSKVIKSKRAVLKEMKENDGDRQKTFLELLIEASGGDKGYTDVELLEESLVMLAAGTDTSAVGAGFVALMLSQHPDVQDKVYQELLEVCGDSDMPITAEHLPRLKYLEAVIKETLRLYPPVPVIARKTYRDCVTPSGLKIIPDIGIVIHIWAIHRNPRYWGADADVFRPERFIDNPPTHPAAYMPFSNGPRNCLGYVYAMMSMKTAIGTILKTYKILPGLETTDKNRPLRVKFEVMMKHVNNYEIKLQTRKVKQENHLSDSFKSLQK